MGVYITDEYRNTITLSAMKRWKKGRFKRTIKELSQFDNKKLEELESSLTILIWTIRIQVRLSKAVTSSI